MNAVPPVEIGRLRADEWRAYRALRLRALADEPLAFGSEYYIEESRTDAGWQDLADRFARSEQQRLYVARAEGQLIGMVGAKLDPTPNRMHIATVVSVFVVPERRGEGISRHLMDALLADLQQVPYLRKVRLNVNPDQTPAIGLYESAGFRIVGRLEAELRIGEAYVDIVLMEKKLHTVAPSPRDSFHRHPEDS